MEYSGYLNFKSNISLPSHYIDALTFNSARSALIFYLIQLDVKKIHLPTYMCPSVFNSLDRYGIQYEKYNINNDLMPENGFTLEKNEKALVVNYFGILDKSLKNKYFDDDAIIFDNTQAYCFKMEGATNIYSPRKFFPLPDGGLLIDKNSPILSQGYSKLATYNQIENFMPNLLSTVGKTSDFYSLHLAIEENISSSDICKMQDLTLCLLKLMPIEKLSKVRRQNFQLMHEFLGNYNEFSGAVMDQALNATCPMVYPLLTSSNIRENLIKRKIFVPRWWKAVSDDAFSNPFERYLSSNLIPLPIDYRYDDNDVKRIAEVVIEELHGASGRT